MLLYNVGTTLFSNIKFDTNYKIEIRFTHVSELRTNSLFQSVNGFQINSQPACRVLRLSGTPQHVIFSDGKDFTVSVL